MRFGLYESILVAPIGTEQPARIRGDAYFWWDSTANIKIFRSKSLISCGC